MRVFEFYQLEFQCIYSKTTGADYLNPVIQSLKKEIGRLTILVSSIVSRPTTHPTVLKLGILKFSKKMGNGVKWLRARSEKISAMILSWLNLH